MHRRRFIALTLVGLISGCAHTGSVPAEFMPDRAVPYRLASGDRLRIIVFGQDSLSNSYAVDAAGRISMPLVGAVNAGGLTTSELERSIEARLRAGYLREPKVSIEVEQYRPFFVLGEVTSSGQYPFVAGLSAQKAIAVAGGFSPRARRDQVAITRVINGETVTATVPIDFPILPGDTITVRERWF